MSNGVAENGGTQAASNSEAPAVTAAAAATATGSAPATPQMASAPAAPAAPLPADVPAPAAQIAAAAVAFAQPVPAQAADCPPVKKKTAHKHDKKETEEEHARAADKDEDQNLSQPADGCVLPQGGQAVAGQEVVATPVSDGGEGGGISSGLLIGAGVLAAVGVGVLALSKGDKNDAPVAGADTGAVNEGASLSGSVATNDSDQDNDPLTFALTGTAPAGLTFNSNGSYTFDANNAAYNGLAAGATQQVVVPYTVSDGRGGSASSTLTITVTGTNDTPVAVADTGPASTEGGAAVTGSVATNDSDPDTGAVLTYSLPNAVPGLTLNTNGTYSFNPADPAYNSLAAGATQTVTATYRVTDAQGASATSTLTFVVTGTNDAPVAVADAAAAVEGGAVVTGSVAANDSDPDTGAVLTYSLPTAVPGLTLNANGTYSFDPTNAAYNALGVGQTQTVVATYSVSDGQGGTTTSTLTITVTGTNDAPVAAVDVNAGNEGAGALTGSVATNDVDADQNAALTYSLNAPVTGLVLNSNGTYSFDLSNPAYNALSAGQQQVVVANYTVTDDQGATSTSTLTITVTGTNDAPVAAVDIASVGENGTVTGDLRANDVDVDTGDNLTYTIPGVTPAGFTLNSDGTFSYTPPASFESLGVGQTATVTVDYQVNDGKGGVANSTLTITINGANDGPNAVPDQNLGSEGAGTLTGSVAANDSDPDNSALTYSLNAPVDGLVLNTDGTYSFDLNNAAYNNLAAGERQTVVAQYTVSDGLGGTATSTLTIFVDGTNDAPVAAVDVNAGVEGAGALTGSVATNDTDADNGAVLTYSLNAPVAGLVLNSNGTYSLDLNDAAYNSLAAGQQLVVPVSYTVTDQQGASSTSTLTITVTGTNDAPVAVVDTANANEGDPVVTGSVAANDVDVDQNAVLTYSLNAPIPGLTLNTDGTYSFDPSNAAYDSLAAGATLVIPSSYTVTDEQGASVPSNLIIVVTGTNDAPVAVVDVNAGIENSIIAGTVANDTDVDVGDVLTYTVSGSVPAGFVLNSNGSYTLDTNDPAYRNLREGEVQNVVVSYQVSDGKGGTANSTLTIAVTGLIEVVSLDVADDADFNTPQVFDGLATDFNFTEDDDIENNVIINNFGADDYITFDAPFAGANSVNFTSFAADGDNIANDLLITTNKGGDVSRIVIRNVVDPATLVFDEASAEAAVAGADNFRSTTESVVVNASLDVDDSANNPNTVYVLPVSANTASFIYSDSAAIENNVRVNGFGADDQIRFDTSIDNVNFTTGDADGDGVGDDLIITVNLAGKVSQIALLDSVSPAALVFDEESAEAAIGAGIDNFRFDEAAPPPPPPPPVGQTAVSLDADDNGNRNDFRVFNAGTGSFSFTDDADAENNAVIVNLGADDRFVLEAGNDYNFRIGAFDSDGQANDLYIEFTKGGNVSVIVIKDVPNPGVLVFDEDTANQALGNIDYFSFA